MRIKGRDVMSQKHQSHLKRQEFLAPGSSFLGVERSNS